MDFIEFSDALIEILNVLVEKDITLSITTNIKNNGMEVKGVIFKKKDINIAPTIYLERFFDEYRNGVELEDIAQRIMAIYKENVIEQNVSFESYTNYDKAKTSLFIRIINFEQNKERLKKVPYRRYLDLAIVVYYCIDIKPFNNATVLVLDEHIKSWKKDKEEVIDDAMENTRKNMKCVFKPMGELLGGTDVPENMRRVLYSNEITMNVVTNARQFYGSVFMVMRSKLDEFYEELGEDYLIIPSSVHELILIPKSKCDDVSVINEMIKEVNANCVPIDEVLSDHCYEYVKGEEALIF